MREEPTGLMVGYSDEPKRSINLRQPFLGWRHEPDAAALLLGILIGLGVCAPLLGGGRVFLLDWSVGPHTVVTSPSFLGLNGGLTAGVGGSLVTAVLNRLLGGVSTWLPILAFFPIATVGAGRLAGRSCWCRAAAGALYAVNPFVFNRIYVGHLPLLLGYALLPYATAAAIRSPSSSVPRWLVPALWWAVLTSLSPHFAWIFGVVIAGVFTVAVYTKQRPLRRVAGWLVVSVSAFAAMSAYLILPYSSTNLPTRLGAVSLSLYRTTSDPHLGLFANVLSLYGFWRTGPGPELPKDVILGWPFVMFAILVVIAIGTWFALHKEVIADVEGEETSDLRSPHPSQLDQKRLAILMLFVGAVGYFLALGDQGPTGEIFLWAYDHVPFFALMREPQKFLMLLALAYAVLFGWGVEQFSHVDISPRRLGSIATAILLGLALPLGYSANIFGGLDGQITTSSLPFAYQQANALMGRGPGNILYLPWHLYMEYPFTGGRVISNVAPTSFSRGVISGDNVEADGVETQSTSPRSAYLQWLFAHGAELRDFGSLVVPLGVKYVVLSKAVDWTSYGWLDHQNDLTLILNNKSLEVWRNEAYRGVGGRVAKLTRVSSYSGVVALASSGELGTGAVISVPDSKNSMSPNSAATSRGIKQLSPVAYRISAGASGWVEVDTAYQRGWSLGGTSAVESAEGTVLVRVGAGGGVLRFTPWEVVRLGYIVSAGLFLIFAMIALFDRRRNPRGADNFREQSR